MKEKLIILFLIFAVFFKVNAQEITYEKFFWTKTFKQYGKPISLKQIQKQMKPNTESFKLIRSARKNNIIGNILALSGGFLLGWELYDALSGNKINGEVLAASAALYGSGFYCEKRAIKKTLLATSLYNIELKKVSYAAPIQLGGFSTMNTNIGFSLTF